MVTQWRLLWPLWHHRSWLLRLLFSIFTAVATAAASSVPTSAASSVATSVASCATPIPGEEFTCAVGPADEKDALTFGHACG